MSNKQSADSPIRGALSCALVAALSSGTHAIASDLALEEVVVTAQKRAENLQDVPISITAISSSDLEARGASSLVDVGNFAPNVQLDQGAFLAGSSQIMTAYIRGIGQRDIAAGLEPGVGVYVDGVFLSRSTGANVDLLDVERVEVLKGPQGTLFGRNTIGGAVSVVTRKPSSEMNGKLKVSVGERDLLDVKGTMDFPLSDTLLTQLSFSRVEQDGYQDIIGFPDDPGSSDERTLIGVGGGSMGSSDTRGGVDNYNLRGKLLWMLSDSTELTFVVDHAKADEEAGAISLVDEGLAGPGTYALVYNTCVSLPSEVIATTPLASICGVRSTGPSTVLPGLGEENPETRLLMAEGVFATGNIDKTYGNGANSAVVETSSVAVTLDTEIHGVSLKSITAYRELESAVTNDLDGTPINLSTTYFYLDHEQWSQEFQINADFFDGKLRTVTGAYYFHEEGASFESAYIGEGLGNFYGPYTTDVDSFAFFVNGNYALSDKLSVTLGARYTEDEKTFTVGQRDWNTSTIKLGLSNPADYPTDDLTLIAAPGTTTDTYDDTSFRVGVEYNVSDSAMVYASFSQGFKSGGIATRLSGPTENNQPLTFDPETAETIEVGIKSQLWNRRWQINAAIFNTEYEDMQITYSIGISPYFDNAGKATIEGFELELQGKPASNVLLTAGVGYLDAEYDELDRSITENTPIGLGNKLVNVPEWSGNLSLDWDVINNQMGTITFHVDYLYKDEMARDSENTPSAMSDSYELVNASLTWRSPMEEWTVSAWGKNITDERFITSTSTIPAVGAPANSWSKPKEFGLTVSYQF